SAKNGVLHYVIFGVELVKIWYFNDSTLNLVKPEFNVNKLIKIEGIGTIDVPNDFYDYCDEVRYSGYLNGDNVAIKKQVNSASGVLNDKLSSQLYEYTSNCTELPGSPVTINLTQLKKVSFPNLTTINISSGTNGLSGCTLLEEMYMPKLTTIYGNTYQDPRRGAFYNVKTVTIPESVDSIGRYSFHTNVKVILNCKNATAIADDAFYNAPTESFVMCSDWGASFNASVAAANWTLQQFIDFLNDSLRDMTLTNQTRTLTIPSARLTELQADTDGAAAIAAANAKGWTIGGA
ncbi:MAG: leucine-rich repeat protein, partial [Ruminococcus sp.]|nr:leucine-rich repeat protein [Ruminococcus sp.]